jgi:hypothetical protein
VKEFLLSGVYRTQLHQRLSLEALEAKVQTDSLNELFRFALKLFGRMSHVELTRLHAQFCRDISVQR